MQERERPKIAPKPIIATKPKYVPPVKIQQRPVTAQNSQNPTASVLHARRSSISDPAHQHDRKPVVSIGEPPPPYERDVVNKRISGEFAKQQVCKASKEAVPRRESFTHKDVYFMPQSEKEPLYPRKEQILQQKQSQALQEQLFGKKTFDEQYRHNTETSLKQENQMTHHMSTFVSDKCDKFYKKTLEVSQKPPNSPSTVCCSILSNAATECCGIINVTKKELNGGSSSGKMTKLDSVDSNSSDSGGFKDFVPIEEASSASVFHHQRKISQPEFLNDRRLSEARPQGHQRKTSQPNFDVSGRSKNYVANAQALAQFLPQTEQKILMHNQKSDEARTRQPKPILSHGNIQQSTKKLEELLAQRLEKEKAMKKGGQNCLIDGANEDAEQKMRIQRQIQQKLHADLEQTVKQIQEIQSTEYRLPQNRKWNESNRSQPAIGLKHTPKSRVST